MIKNRLTVSICASLLVICGAFREWWSLPLAVGAFVWLLWLGEREDMRG